MTHTIAIDIDGVVFNAQQAHLDSANKLFDTSYTLEDVTRFDYNNFPRRVKEHFLKCWDMLDYNTIAPVEGFYEAMLELQQLGRVIAVTSPMAGSLHITSKWDKVGRLFGQKNVVLTQSKELIAADILVEDAPKFIEPWMATGKPIVIMEQPWNRDYRLSLSAEPIQDWVSVSNFSDIPKAVEGLLIW